MRSWKIKNNDGKEIKLNMVKTEPKKIDIDEIYNEVYKEPQDAYYTKNPFQVFAHVDGVNFDLDAARQLLEEDKEEYVIDLIITTPKVTTDQIGTEAFPNLLSTFSTKYDASLRDRTNNLQLLKIFYDIIQANVQTQLRDQKLYDPENENIE